jgi:hypothetical protein
MQGFPCSEISGGIHQQGFASGLSCKLFRAVVTVFIQVKDG